jgi:uncharacterized protein (DUF2141 family)
MRIIAIILFQLASSIGLSQDIEVTIKNIKATNGKINIDIYDNKNDFLKKPLMSKRIAINNDMIITISFEGLKPGEYAIGVIHDLNDNGKLDTNFIGIPREPIGTSNNPKPRLGPPKWDDAKFQLSSDEKRSVVIELQYD